MLARFCGPAAVAALTGLTPDEAAALVVAYRQRQTMWALDGSTTKYRGRLQRGSTYPHEVVAALQAAGRLATREPFAGNLRKLLRWLEEEGGSWLVLVPGHWTAIIDGKIASGKSLGERTRVVAVYRVTRQAQHTARLVGVSH